MKFDMTGLNNLIKALDSNKVVKVGIFAGKSSRSEAGEFSAKLGHRKKTKTPSSLTNPELGVIHEGFEREMGSFSKGTPARSFLRMPLMKKSNEIVKKASEGAAELLAAGKIETILKRIGIAAESVIQEAFESGGFGLWAPDKPSTIKRKGSSSPLIDTGQLRRSITSKVDYAS